MICRRRVMRGEGAETWHYASSSMVGAVWSTRCKCGQCAFGAPCGKSPSEGHSYYQGHQIFEPASFAYRISTARPRLKTGAQNIHRGPAAPASADPSVVRRSSTARRRPWTADCRPRTEDAGTSPPDLPHRQPEHFYSPGTGLVLRQKQHGVGPNTRSQTCIANIPPLKLPACGIQTFLHIFGPWSPVGWRKSNFSALALFYRPDLSDVFTYQLSFNPHWSPTSGAQSVAYVLATPEHQLLVK